MIKALREPLRELAEFQKLRDAVTGSSTLTPKGTAFVTGCVDSQKLHLIAGLSEDVRCTVIVTYDDLRARALWEEYAYYDRDACLFPAKDLIFFQADIHGNELTRQRMRTVRRLLESPKATVITTFAALMTPQPPIREDATLYLEKGGTCEPAEFARRLTELGYERVAQTESPGQFAVRGDIIDVFDLTEDSPYRIELWGDDVESLRRFDAFSQRSIEELEEITVYPATEFVLTGQELRDGADRILAEAEKQEKTLRETFHTEEAHRVKTTAKELYDRIVEYHGMANLDSYARYFYPDSLLSVPQWLTEVSGGPVCFFVEEPARVREQAQAVELEFRESFAARLEKGYALPGQTALLLSPESVAASMEKAGVVGLSALIGGSGYFTPVYKYDIDARNIAPYGGSFESLTKDLQQYRKQKFGVLLFCASRTRGERLAEDLRDLEIPAAFSEDPEREIVPGEVLIVYGRIARGFEYPLIKFAALSESDIFGAERKKTRRRHSAMQGSKISSLEDLHPGDYVVHETYGLGIYRGIEKVESGSVRRDYIRLEYKDGGILYVLATELDAVQKYASADADHTPKLNKLGTKEWEKTKSKVRSSVEGIAKDLVELYAKRQMTEGIPYGPDTVWQKEFEELFPFEETQDQLAAIRDTKADMESGRIMDRLICGDVGFGKTEIAIRAAFKAVQEGRQVAYLVPTTILAQQHYNTFAQRMKDFPVRVELLSRFRSAKEIRSVLTDLRKGLVDIVIGTHRLLSDDVEYKNLGLLIIDEEQRFGVSHKEKIKKIRENVDVLTLSATPIPRTLHMSLVGIRDMSILEEAPQDRVPIQTFVCEYNEELVREAITRELARGGQVYYLYNRVGMIADMAAQIQAMVPGAVVAYAHGQMHERELENVMVDFVEGQIDVLVCTTIIETGMDISNVNTLIIHDSDRMGLSQLYQLRGRVGRSSRTAYAFLMYKRDKILTEVAEKRLEAIREFTDLGSGFRIAMRDLEIRGAGNLLGKSQHGHMEAVGYDLYCKMLGEEVAKLKGVRQEESFSTVINLDADAFIPAEYIVNEEQKLDMYKRIACIESEAERDAMRDELLDRFGALPESAENLLRIAVMRDLAHRLDMTEVLGGEGRILFRFKRDARIDPSGIPELVKKHGGRLGFEAFKIPTFTYRYDREPLAEKEEQQVMALTEELLREMQPLRLAPEAGNMLK